MTPMQEKLLEMLMWFHSYCEHNNLTYYTVGGTALGAVRHKGFIPWDDDIDVAMPRKDFLILLEKLENQQYQGYKLESYMSGHKDYIYPFAKLYDTSTTLIEDVSQKAVRGIYIDIFPLDGIGESKEEAIINYKRIDKWLNFLSARTLKMRKGRKLYKNILLVTVQFFTPPFISLNCILKKINEIASSQDFDSSVYVGNLVGAWRYKEIMPRKYFGRPTLYDFEGYKLFGPEKYDEYLSSIYGNWRKLPSLDKQKSTHTNIVCDLNKPYSSYKNNYNKSI